MHVSRSDEVFYDVVASPVGPLLLAATAAGLVRVAFAGEDHDAVLSGLARDSGTPATMQRGRLAEAAGELDEYFAGCRERFGLPLDLRRVHGFRRTVLDRLPEIGRGATATYAEVAAGTGSPTAARAVGAACGANPLPVVLPCHRVVRGDGSLGGYLGGTETKRMLLALEASWRPAA
ncbi:MAG: methylated-DNA--[protein]-cysteine S-methyltransferase [Chloroflexia bacterium]|nr:methylated-DNA--[protein]-cysteine S-methyltransferase [Chloroflexia bacterium]